MADGNSTRKCQVCANIYLAKLTKSGKPSKTKHSYCSAECTAADNRARALSYYHKNKPGDGRHAGTCGHCGNDFTSTRKRTYCSVECRTAYNTHKARSAVKPPCAVQGCDSRVAGRGLCSKHYHWFMTHGSTEKPPRKPRKLKRVTKPCEWCGGEMQLKPAQVDKTECCSRSCSNLLRAKREGKAIRLTKFWCAGCHKQVERTVKTSKDSGKYCSKACALAVKSRVSAERAALRRIGDRRRSRERERYDTMVRPEVQALRRIALRCNDPARNIACANCGAKARRLRPFFKFCSLVCKREKDKKRREEYRQSEAYKALKRAAKSRRRALLRTATADSIDPLKVFERDQWKCHLCGCKTLKSKRGTIHDRAPELEHIISLAEGGTHTWGNVACACRKCNISKGSNSTGQLGLQIAC